MAMATRVAGDKKGNANSDEEGGGNQSRQHWQWLRQRGWRAFDSGDDGDGAKDTPTGTTTGERGMMVTMGHGLCVCFGVCGETTKNKEKSKIVNVS
jgi:hypothetical protein